MNPKLKTLGPLCNQAVNLTPKTLYRSLLKLKYTRFIVKHNKDSKKYVSLSKSLENSHVNHTNSVFYKKGILWSIDRSLRPTRKHMNYFASLGIFIGQGRRRQR